VRSRETFLPPNETVSKTRERVYFNWSFAKGGRSSICDDERDDPTCLLREPERDIDSQEQGRRRGKVQRWIELDKRSLNTAFLIRIQPDFAGVPGIKKKYRGWEGTVRELRQRRIELRRSLYRGSRGRDDEMDYYDSGKHRKG